MGAVLDELLDACERAYQSKYPVIFLKTEEMEMVRRVAGSDRLVVRLQKARGASPGELRYERGTSRPYVRWAGENALLNVLPERGLGRSGGPEGFARMVMAHVGRLCPEPLMNEIADFADRYSRETDDNGALRSSLYLLYGDPAGLSPEVQEVCAILDVGLPGQAEIAGIIAEKVAEYGLEPLEAEQIQEMAYQLGGFSVIQVEQLLGAILAAPETDGFNVIRDHRKTRAIIRERKQQMLQREQVLSLVAADNRLRIGGMRGFMEWFGRQARCICEAGRMQRETGVGAPRGVLMCGVPGCGKSMAAKAVAAELGIPLLQMEVGKLMGRFMGESEKNMDRALKLAEAMSPCVLWIDELDKGFSGAGSSGDSDSGVFKRVFGQLLTWMQECKKPCFIFATANDITGMPKEFFRSGRFDALFAVYMPTRDECVDILKNQMRMAEDRALRAGGGRLFDEGCYDPDALCACVDDLCRGTQSWNTDRFVTGADIEKLVAVSLRSLWMAQGAVQRVKAADWRGAMQEALRTNTVYGDGTENLDSLAMCYLRLVRSNFQPVSGAESVLFASRDYRVELDEAGGIRSAGFVRDEKRASGMTAYDRALYEALLKRIGGLALLFEQNARYRLVR